MLEVPNEKAEVVVKADKNIKSAKIMTIMNAAQDAEYKKLVVAGEPLNKKEQQEIERKAGQVDVPKDGE